MLPSRKRWRNRAPCHDTTAVNSIAVKSESSVKMGFYCFLRVFGATKKWKATRRRSPCNQIFQRSEAQQEDPSVAPLIYSIKSLIRPLTPTNCSSYLLLKALERSLLWHPGNSGRRPHFQSGEDTTDSETQRTDGAKKWYLTLAAPKCPGPEGSGRGLSVRMMRYYP